jgi:mono/diheme cytochrome c family protein
VSKTAKSVVIVVAAVLGLMLAGLASVYYTVEARLNKVYAIPTESVPIPDDPEGVRRGEHLVVSFGQCIECHGQDLSGGEFFAVPALGSIYSSNLTSGQGGVGTVYSDADWVRAIRHGVGPDGRPLIIMPSHFYYYFSDEDLGAIIAYLRSLPAVDKDLPETELGPLGRLFLLSEKTLIPAEVIDHDAPRPAAPEPGVTAAYGEYLAIVCKNCHGPDLRGGTAVSAGANLIGGEVAGWTEAEFINTLRTGVTPAGRKLSPEMPADNVGQMSDEELRAIWAYIQSLANRAEVEP